MSDSIGDTLSSIRKLLMDGPLSISDIAKKTDRDWRTAQQYLNIMDQMGLVFMKNIKNTKTYFLKDRKNYFELPIKKRDHKLISTIYHKIRATCLEFFNKEPTKTQVYKIIWRVNKELNLGLPIGWYKYGPCCVQIYYGDELDSELDKKTTLLVKETTKEYCQLDNFQLQGKIYGEENQQLYLLKERILSCETNDKKELNALLLDFIRLAPKEAVEVVTDYARAVLLLNQEKTRFAFKLLWGYLSKIAFKESLKDYYSDSINEYFDEKIEFAKKEAQLEITNLVNVHVDSKYSQEKKYQSWKKTRKSA